jgi:hypothetical protein
MGKEDMDITEPVPGDGSAELSIEDEDEWMEDDFDIVSHLDLKAACRQLEQM